MKKKVILTGDRPTGKLHIGHYFGSLQNRIKLQDEYEQYIIIADIQALTDNFENPQKVRDNVFELCMDYLAVGIDPSKSTIFIQSMIPEIAELTVIYSNLVTISRLEQNPTVKDEIKQKKEIFGESVTFGFLGYPISQAADITAFDGELVPVGEDQLPVLEQTREIVRKFNNIYGKTLIEPQAKISNFPRLKGTDGDLKMGKSLGNAIYLSGTKEEITKKIKKSPTDPSKIHLGDPGNPEICNVFYYHNIFSGKNIGEISKTCKSGERGCAFCKNELIGNIEKFIAPIREKRKYFEERPDLVKEILFEGTKKAREKAKQVMNRVREKVKLSYF